MNNSEIDIRIAGVREVPGRSRIDRLEIMRCTHGGIFRTVRPEEITVGLSVRFDTKGSDMLSVTATATYSCIRSMVKRRLLDYTVETLFEIPGMDANITMADNRIDIPPHLMTLLLSATIGALRGMLAMRTSGTALADYPLPLINISTLVSRLTYGTESPRNPFPIANFVYN